MPQRVGSQSFRHGLPIVGGFILLAGGSAAAAFEHRHGSVSFDCENGAGFSVAYVAGRARITTPAGRWLLERRPSSIGRRYSSGDATFIHDEDRAALNGLPGGPFRRCREAAPRQ